MPSIFTDARFLIFTWLGRRWRIDDRRVSRAPYYEWVSHGRSQLKVRRVALTDGCRNAAFGLSWLVVTIDIDIYLYLWWLPIQVLSDIDVAPNYCCVLRQNLIRICTAYAARLRRVKTANVNRLNCLSGIRNIFIRRNSQILQTTFAVKHRRANKPGFVDGRFAQRHLAGDCQLCC